MPRPVGSKTKVLSDALVLALNREAKDTKGKPTKKLNNIAAKLVSLAEDGDMQAIKEVFDRVEGKPVQQQILSGDDENPIHQVIKRVIVDSKG